MRAAQAPPSSEGLECFLEKTRKMIPKGCAEMLSSLCAPCPSCPSSKCQRNTEAGSFPELLLSALLDTPRQGHWWAQQVSELTVVHACSVSCPEEPLTVTMWTRRKVQGSSRRRDVQKHHLCRETKWFSFIKQNERQRVLRDEAGDLSLYRVYL